MNREEFKVAIEMFKTNYPGFKLSKEKEAMWFSSLENMETEKVFDNVRKHIETSGEYPNLCDLRNNLNSEDSWVDEWLKVMDGERSEWNDTTKKLSKMLGIDTDTPNALKASKIRDFERLYRMNCIHGDRTFKKPEECEREDVPDQEEQGPVREVSFDEFKQLYPDREQEYSDNVDKLTFYSDGCVSFGNWND